MGNIKIAGIMRAGAFSPNHIGNDAAIFNLTCEQLRKRGCEVKVYSEEQFMSSGVEEEVIVDMCREQRSYKRLQQLEDEGRLVINSGYGIENATRERMTRILLGSGLPYPKSLMVNTDERVVEALRKAGIHQCWIKRGESHAQHKEDVTYVRHPEEAQEVLQEFFLRGIRRAVINTHLQGDLVKFYGVRDTNFFYWFYPYDEGHPQNGAGLAKAHSKGYAFREERLKAICQAAAEALDLVVYGGDCIVAEDGSMQIIDFNDWPSFAPCRAQAAPHIARRIVTMVKEHQQREGSAPATPL